MKPWNSARSGGSGSLVAIGIIAAFVLAAAYAFSASSKFTVAGEVVEDENGKKMSGTVLQNVVPNTPFGGPSYAFVLEDSGAVRTLHYGPETECRSASASADGSALEPGDRIEAYGSAVTDTLFSVCLSGAHFIEKTSAGSVYDDWSEYRDDVIGISFGHPPAWTRTVESLGTGNDSVIRVSEPGATAPVLAVSIFRNVDFGSDEWVGRFYGEQTTPGGQAIVKKVEGVFKGKRVTELTLADPGKPGSQGYIMVLKHDSSVVQIEYAVPVAGDVESEARQALVRALVEGFAFAPTRTGVETAASGVMGTATIGPVCPVGRIDAPAECGYRPHSANLRAVGIDGFVTRFASDAKGSFRASLPPGMYMIESDSGQPLPSLAPVQVIVRQGSYASVDLVFDSGIR